MSTWHRWLVGILLAAGWLWGAAESGQAEVSPPPAPHGASLAPPADSGAGLPAVRLAAQEVLIEAQRNAGGQPPYARVTASYWLRSESAQDEALTLRFPLSTVDHFDGRQSCDLSPFMPLQEFRAWVDERPLYVGIRREPADSTLWSGAQPPPERVLDCWAIFTVHLPAGAEAVVRLSYRQEAGVEGYPGYALYRHALQPASGWQGSVGSTRVIFRAPWTLTEENFPGHAFPIERLVDGLRVERHENEIHWTFGELEPDAQADIVVGTMNPAAYSAINRGRMLYPGSRDADTWGRYALAAKQAALYGHSFRADAAGDRLFHESYEAYTRVLELVPWSATWQAGFAELLCTNAAYPTFDLHWSEEERWQACARRLKAALDLNPEQELALRVLARYGDERYAALQDGRPVFPALSLALPPRSTATPLVTETAPAVVNALPTPSPQPSATLADTAAPTPTDAPLPLAAVETATVPAASAPAEAGTATAAAPTPAPVAAPPAPGRQAIFLAALLPLAAIFALIVGWRRKRA